MKRILERILIFILAAAVTLSAVPAASFAAAAADPEMFDFTYHFNSGETESGGVPKDTVTWRDDCFRRFRERHPGKRVLLYFLHTQPIRPGLTHAEDLSVAGNRAEKRGSTGLICARRKGII